MPTRRFRTSRVARFGDFELDLRAGELRRSGVRSRLQEQPYRILAMLLEQPGEVVLRDEIRKRLWPNDTVVEIGHGINAAVLRLREALGESAESPRYIETLPRRGYRFNGDVEWEQPEALTVAGGTAAAGSGADAELVGRTISHYRVMERLGSGGMGVVYRAEDLHLGRHVALKFLAREFARDAAARERFQREARAASALNHPNVCTVYGVEDLGGQPAISMELVEGETLAALLSKGPLPASEARTLAMQAAAALEAAHRKGVVHRDLKPGNLMVTSCGLKVLDFGIAKIDVPGRRGSVTERGDVMGTPDYMSPEQVQGRETDARSDIYSLGLVLREMLTGKKQGGVLSAEWERVVGKCVAEDAGARWQTAGELRAELERLTAAPAADSAPTPAARRAPGWWPMAVAVVLCAAAGLVFSVWRAAQAPVRFLLSGAEESKGVRLKVSPDGRAVAFSSGSHLFVREFERREAAALPAPEGLGSPFWSADGRSVAVPLSGELLRVGLSPGSVPVKLGRVNTNLGGAWGPDGTILIGLVNDGIYRVAAAGGAMTRVTEVDAARGETRHLMPQYLPGGRRFLYIAGSAMRRGSMLWAASLDSPGRTEVMPMQSNFVFVPFSREATQGYLVYLRDGLLVAQPFDSGRLGAMGEPYALAPFVAANMAVGTLVSSGDFSATAGTLVYRTREAITVVRNWMSEVGRAQPR